MKAFICIALLCAASVGQTSAQREARHAMAAIQAGTDEGVSGEIHFFQESEREPIQIRGHIDGLAAGLHGLHVHQDGNLTSACSDSGPHFNPDGVNHGAQPNPRATRHVADLGNVVASENGTAAFDIDDHLQSLYEGGSFIAGRAIVIHALEDDLGLGGDDGSKATGNAGARLGCGLIVLQKE